MRTERRHATSKRLKRAMGSKPLWHVLDKLKSLQAIPDKFLLSLEMSSLTKSCWVLLWKLGQVFRAGATGNVAEFLQLQIASTVCSTPESPKRLWISHLALQTEILFILRTRKADSLEHDLYHSRFANRTAIPMSWRMSCWMLEANICSCKLFTSDFITHSLLIIS